MVINILKWTDLEVRLGTDTSSLQPLRKHLSIKYFNLMYKTQYMRIYTQNKPNKIDDMFT